MLNTRIFSPCCITVQCHPAGIMVAMCWWWNVLVRYPLHWGWGPQLQSSESFEESQPNMISISAFYLIQLLQSSLKNIYDICRFFFLPRYEGISSGKPFITHNFFCKKELKKILPAFLCRSFHLKHLFQSMNSHECKICGILCKWILFTVSVF